MDAEQLKAILSHVTEMFQEEQNKALDHVAKAQSAALEKVTKSFQEQQEKALDQVAQSVNLLKDAVESVRNPQGGRAGNGGGGTAPRTRQWQMLQIFVKSHLDLED